MQARSQGGTWGAMHPPNLAKIYKMCQKWGFCRRVEWVEVQKVHFWGVRREGGYVPPGLSKIGSPELIFWLKTGVSGMNFLLKFMSQELKIGENWS